MTAERSDQVHEGTEGGGGGFEVQRLSGDLAALHDPDQRDGARTLFEEGSGFDGSSIRGWQPIHASDMLVMPDPTTAVMDPFMRTSRRCR